MIGDNLVASAPSGFLKSGADVMMTKAGNNVNASIVISNNAKLDAQGISANGINVGYGLMAVILGDNATVSTKFWI